MIGAVKSIAKVIFDVLNFKFSAGDVSFSLWNIIMTFLICGLVGILTIRLLNPVVMTASTRMNAGVGMCQYYEVEE